MLDIGTSIGSGIADSLGGFTGGTREPIVFAPPPPIDSLPLPLPAVIDGFATIEAFTFLAAIAGELTLPTMVGVATAASGGNGFSTVPTIGGVFFVILFFFAFFAKSCAE